MTKQAQELAWDISDWDEEADISESNIRRNMEETFFKNGLTLPSSIVVRVDQRQRLLEEFRAYAPNADGIYAIDLGFGAMRLKVVPHAYTKGVRL